MSQTTLRILIVITSHSQLGDTGEQTGFWLEELASPYYTESSVFCTGSRARVAKSALNPNPAHKTFLLWLTPSLLPDKAAPSLQHL